MIQDSNGALLSSTARPQGIEGTILIVDDQEMVRTMVADLLGDLNYNVITAVDGHEAVNTLKRMKENTGPDNAPVDLVILDMILPKMDGRETFKKLKEIDPGLKVLLSTGYDVNNKVNEVLSEGAVGFIQKPYHIDKLVGIVKEHISAEYGKTCS